MTPWLTKQEVAALTGWSHRWIEFKANTGALRSRAASSQQRAAKNGKAQREYEAASLPAEFQLKLARLRVGRENSCDALAVTSKQAALKQATVAQPSLFTAVPQITDEQLDPAQVKLVRERLEIIAPLLEYREAAAAGKAPRILVAGNKIESLDELARWVGAQHSVSVTTLYRWLARYRKHGDSGLARGPRSDKNSSRFFAEFPKAAEYVQNKYLNERLSIALTHEALIKDWPEIYNHGSSAPSYTTIRDYLAKLPNALRVMAREGETAFKNKIAPFGLRDYRTVKVNQIWVSDHMQHDVFVRNDFLPGARADAAIRPYLTAIMDIRSRKVVGVAWCVNPSSQSIASAMRVAVTRFGLPEIFYMDNGKDYKKVGRQDELCEAASGLMTRLGVKSVHAIPRHPQSKPIESWFRTLHKRLDARFHPFYCGPSHDQRPEECALALKHHQEWLDQKRQRSPLPLASEFMRMALCWIEQEYNSEMPHSGHAMNGRSPNEVFAEEHSQSKPSPSMSEMAPLFWDRQRRTLTEGGCVQLFSQRYEPADGPSIAALRLLPEHFKREVLIACDPLNVGQALAFDLDGQFLGVLQCSKLLAWGPASFDDIRAAKRDEKNFRRSVKDYMQGLGNLRSGDITEQERLRRDAGLPTIITAETLESEPLRLAAASGHAVSAARPGFDSADRRSVAAPTYTDDVVDEVRSLMKQGGGDPHGV